MTSCSCGANFEHPAYREVEIEPNKIDKEYEDKIDEKLTRLGVPPRLPRKREQKWAPVCPVCSKLCYEAKT